MFSPAHATRPLGAFDACSLIPFSFIQDLVATVDCNPAGRAALSAAIVAAATPAPGPNNKPVAPPAWAPFVAQLGPAVFVDCLCKGKAGAAPVAQPQQQFYYPPSQPWYQSPWVIGGIVVGALVLAYTMSKPARPEEP